MSKRLNFVLCVFAAIRRYFKERNYGQEFKAEVWHILHTKYISLKKKKEKEKDTEDI